MNSKKNKTYTLGQCIRNLRFQRHLSLNEVSKEIGIDTSLLGKIERDKRLPTREQIKLVANFYKYDEQKLILEYLSDQFAYKILEANIDFNILKVAEQKINYLKMKK